MATATSTDTMPRPVLSGAVALVVFALALAGLGSAGLIGETASAPPAALETRSVVFVDRDDGAVTVEEPGHPGTLVEFAPGTNGFVRGALRGLARDRKRRGIGPEVPFLLARRADGRLMLEDPATGAAIDLAAFGPSNIEPFLMILAAERRP